MPKKINKHIEITPSTETDSVVFNLPVKDSVATPSLFQNNLLVPKSTKPSLHFTNYNYWVAGTFMFLFILFIWIYTTNQKKLGQVIRGFYQTRFANINARDEYSVGNRVSVFLSAFFVITVSIFVSQILAYYHIQIYKNIPAEVIVGLLLVFIYSIKFVTIKLLGSIFLVQKEATEYIISIFLFCNVLGLFMLPLVICLLFMDQVPQSVFIDTGIVLVTIFLFIRMARGIFIGLKSQRVSKVYLFMYLCTLEILPFVLMAKLVLLKIE